MLKSWHSISFPFDKQKGSTCLRGSTSTGPAPAPPQAPFLFSTWQPTWPRCTSHTRRDLGTQLHLFSGVLPAGLDSGLTLGSLLSWPEGLLAGNSENVGTGSLTSGMTSISKYHSPCREIISIFMQVLLSYILGMVAEPSALKDQEQRRFCPTATRLLTEFTHSPEFLSPFHFHSHQKA